MFPPPAGRAAAVLGRMPDASSSSAGGSNPTIGFRFQPSPTAATSGLSHHGFLGYSSLVLDLHPTTNPTTSTMPAPVLHHLHPPRSSPPPHPWSCDEGDQGRQLRKGSVMTVVDRVNSAAGAAAAWGSGSSAVRSHGTAAEAAGGSGSSALRSHGAAAEAAGGSGSSAIRSHGAAAAWGSGSSAVRSHGAAAAGLGVGAVRMKKAGGGGSATKARRKVREPRFCFKTMSDVDVLDDGYKWRKYGQKVVKNTQHPRSYYRCTQDKCRVKKRVERLAEDPRMVITTYEGRHVHSPSRDDDAAARADAEMTFIW